MLQTEDKRRLVQACFPKDDDEASSLWHEIKPVKFGDELLWAITAGGVHQLATFQVPQDADYLYVSRVECYVYTEDPAAAGFGIHMPPPSGQAYWLYTEQAGLGVDEIRLTPNVPTHILLDTEEFIIAEGNYRLVLTAEIAAPPANDTYFIRTTVYAYLLGGDVAGKIGDAESTYFGDIT